MNRNNKIVRTKKTFNLYDSKERQYFKTELMTFDNYIKEYNWKVNGQKFELYPYKWFDLRWIYEKPSYLLLHIFSKSLNKDLNRHKTIRITTRLIIGLFEIIAAYSIGKILDIMLLN